MKTLLMLGDSLVEWGQWEDLLPEITVLNRGIAGETTEELAGRFIQEITSLQQPDALLIQSGTNSLLLGNPYFPAIFQSMVPAIREFYPTCPIIINSLMPMPIVPVEELKEVNDQLKQIATMVSNCHYLDTVGPFNEKCLPITHPGFLTDKVHLSTRGYQVWAAAIATCLASLASQSNNR